ncbi:MAG: gamma-glutamylcyclotransferase [Chloroflexi bacterium]|nr:gamma-glutamylcyclotransferase [Ardenticatenaceae bacterium]MBL1131065.1 gamma-glutamylcyclotransferase [Chloroflexota bacterium]NOG37164.1 gamma-glutamylcyclotransferase [Chloroflexota bacterium]GIK54840.1 MAG: gamma-glutamylcyclotransferase [Chloroflexota bacterium]
MTNDTPYLPFFVYGSLLPGQANAALWGDSVVAQQAALLAHGRLYSLGDYPVLIENGGGPVKGMVMTARPDAYADLLARLDALEAYNPDAPEQSEYLRVIREARLGDGTAVPIWVYIGQVNYAPHLPLVPDGDWLAYVAARELKG